jgi:opacity protein-like surface antigen
VKRRTWIAVVSALLLNSFALAQTTSHFDLSGNVTFSGAKLANAPSASTQIDSFGWQTSGVTHLSRWLSLTSQFGSGYASANSLQLIGYAGPGKITHYSMLIGPRITIPMRGRVSPFVEGLVGGDRASTQLNSNGVSVTGREMQLAYSVGGGAQVNLNRRFGVNVEAQYLTTEHSLAFTGWQPASFQVSAGIVIRMFSRTPQIAERRPVGLPVPDTSVEAQPAVVASTPSAPEQTPTSSSVAPTIPPSAQPSVASFVTSNKVEPASAPMPVASIQPPSTPAVEAVSESKPAFVATTTPKPQPVAPAAASAPLVTSPVPVMSAKVSVPAPARVAQPAPRPVVAVAPAAVAVAPSTSAPAPAPAPRVVAQTQVQPTQVQSTQPLSLGEYARRLREQKQRERQQQQQQQ